MGRKARTLSTIATVNPKTFSATATGWIHIPPAWASHRALSAAQDTGSGRAARGACVAHTPRRRAGYGRASQYRGRVLSYPRTSEAAASGQGPVTDLTGGDPLNLTGCALDNRTTQPRLDGTSPTSFLFDLLVRSAAPLFYAAQQAQIFTSASSQVPVAMAMRTKTSMAAADSADVPNRQVFAVKEHHRLTGDII
ncbi:hypothetical protein BDK51DRAFT_36943 [Blyttiomyces helicus]|uniref:Uncharacterized protein n=1 Tax=Blyttiomyces helicus TaxID=388810 RepID=A0A4P9W8K8_9FUNG|nr:hypothetical protein BDK51DRAFT_36943 [Blyttiomyces helicus]|eukprot:RKO88452.1 hypothetical protein BDK51DRAFT_36943 [Blyttiomyces helicus]